MVNKNKICFILCTNHRIYEEECLFYLKRLQVPEGYEVDIITVKDAKSLTSGYNAAMKSSDAKYKIYLHQDVFIINEYFIRDVLNIFMVDSKIGMVGMVGNVEVPNNIVMWEGQRFGNIYGVEFMEQKVRDSIRQISAPYLDVKLIDGFLMATQYDITWRDDIFDKWDFYDASQCMEFIKAGYRIVVPKQVNAWCIHDCGILDFNNYDNEKNKFVLEYKDYIDN